MKASKLLKIKSTVPQFIVIKLEALKNVQKLIE